MFNQPTMPPGGATVQFGTPAAFQCFGFCDGTVKRGIGACAFALLSFEGLVQATGWVTLNEPTSDSTHVEFEGLVRLLSEAASAGIRRLWVGTDSFQVLEHVRHGAGRYQPALQALHRLVAQFDYLQIQAIARKHNKLADALARKGIAHIR